MNVYVAAMNVHYEDTVLLDEDGEMLGPDDTIPSHRSRRTAQRIADKACAGKGMVTAEVYRIRVPE